MSKTMTSPDAALKEFFKDNEIFADIFNSYFFNNDEIIRAKDLEPDNTVYTATIKLNGKTGKKNRLEKINKYRDNIRRTKIGYLVILGIEDQNKIHYSMPIRTMLYDVLGYSTELSAMSKSEDRSNWTVDEILSKVKRGTKVTPIMTVVFYTGEDPWDGPRSLHDMLNVDDKIKEHVPDYPLNIIDIGHDKDLSFKCKELNELKDMLSSIYSNTLEQNENYIQNSIIALSGILARDEKIYYSAIKSKEGRQKMCRVLAERDERIRKEVAREYEGLCRTLKERNQKIREEVAKEYEEKQRVLKERNQTIREEVAKEYEGLCKMLKERNQTIREEVAKEYEEKQRVLEAQNEKINYKIANKDAEIANKDAEIARLKQLLAAASK